MKAMLVLLALLVPGVAIAQDATMGLREVFAVGPGAIHGFIRDQHTGEPVIGATVVVTGPAISPLTGVSDENGFYTFEAMPPRGDYRVTVYYADLTIERADVAVTFGKTSWVNVKLDSDFAGGEILEDWSIPMIDFTTTEQVWRLSDQGTFRWN